MKNIVRSFRCHILRILMIISSAVTSTASILSEYFRDETVRTEGEPWGPRRLVFHALNKNLQPVFRLILWDSRHDLVVDVDPDHRHTLLDRQLHTVREQIPGNRLVAIVREDHPSVRKYYGEGRPGAAVR